MSAGYRCALANSSNRLQQCVSACVGSRPIKLGPGGEDTVNCVPVFNFLPMAHGALLAAVSGDHPTKAKGFVAKWFLQDSPVPLILVDRDPCHTSPDI